MSQNKDNRMSVLASISKPADRAPIITIVGDAGTGKTSLAATFPESIFIRAEDGLQSILQTNVLMRFRFCRKRTICGRSLWLSCRRGMNTRPS